jgi:hypothetical protein
LIARSEAASRKTRAFEGDIDVHGAKLGCWVDCITNTRGFNLLPVSAAGSAGFAARPPYPVSIWS